MNIVVLDGYTLNPGDLSWEQLSKHGELTVYERTSKEDIVARAAHADIILTNKVPLDQETLRQLPGLKYIGVLATGYNIVDTKEAAARGITVTNVPDYSTNSVVQLVFALLLQLSQRTAEHSTAVHQGRWSAGPDFMFALSPLMELAGKKLGIIGYGEIGQQVARVATAFGMKVLVHTRTHKQIEGLGHVQFVSLDGLFTQSDVISLHCPLNSETAGIVNKRTLGQMKPTSFLINTARGGHIQEQDLADALYEGKIAGAGLDVLSLEPPAADHPLIGAPNCYITPHIAWATFEARTRLMNIAAANIEAYLQGNTVNKVN